MLLPLASLLIFAGTYTPKDGASQGIYAVRLDPGTGAFSAPVLAAKTPNPTFLAAHPNGRVLYALGESPTGGAAAAFTIDAAAGTLALLNQEASGGGGFCYVGLDATARVLVGISYGSGQVSAFPVGPDGRLGPVASLLTTTGTPGPNRAPQDAPHAHSATFSPDNRFVYVCDLGLDQILRYRIDHATARLTLDGVTPTAPGAGPRHSKFSGDGRFFHVINELDSTIATYGCDPATGRLTPLQTVSTLPAGFKGENICAEIRVHPGGRFVYGSNRGHDSLAVFARDSATGRLTLVEIVPSGGSHPRNFNLTPDGGWLVCANRGSDNLVSFKVDPATGRLTATGHTATVPKAVCVLFAVGGN
jgi:6-phosphogluconolactonase